MAASRPFFQSSTSELRGIVENPSSSREMLLKVLAELQHRERPQAIRLKERLEEILSAVPEPPPKDEHLSQTIEACDGIFFEDETHSYERPAEPIKRPVSRRSLQDDLTEQNKTAFRLVEPNGVQGRPSAYRPPLQTNIMLELSEIDSLVKKYRVALEALISEMKKKGSGIQSFSLDRGTLVNTDGGVFAYQFDFAEEANLFEGAKVDVHVGSQAVQGSIAAVMQGQIIVSLASDYGEEIRNCVLKIDNTALLQALAERLKKIESGEDNNFRADFAEQVIKNNWVAQRPAPIPAVKSRNLNSEQIEFIQVALSNDISWLWGPPGTGKTQALSALTELFYQEGRRVLICSNTNQAVDQVLLKFCDDPSQSAAALDQGHVLRLGKIELDKLRDRYEEKITVDGVVARKSEALLARKKQIESELLRLEREVASAAKTLIFFNQLDQSELMLRSAQRDLSSNQQIFSTASEDLQKLHTTLKTYEDELAKWSSAGAFHRLLLRKEDLITQDLLSTKSRLEKSLENLENVRSFVESSKDRVNNHETQVSQLKHLVQGQDREILQAAVSVNENQREPLRSELAALNRAIDQLKETVLKEARIVGATVTRTFLRPEDFRGFDTIIIDEASMIPLPAVFHAAGMSKRSVIIAGDFLQLPPIIQTSEKEIHDLLSHDAFEVSGISARIKQSSKVGNLVALKSQYRMEKDICQYVSKFFYQRFNNELTSPRPPEDPPELLEPFNQTITLIDTSRIYPFTTRNFFGSRFNLMHALAVRNAVMSIRDSGCLLDNKGLGRIGICSPYAAQAKLLRKILSSNNLGKDIRASTAHGFQGDERSIIVLDLVDSFPERNAGVFLQAEEVFEQGAKLLNVAISRAKHAIIVLANLTFLDAKLPGGSILRGILNDMQKNGRILDVRDVLALRPILDDLRRFSGDLNLDTEALRTGLFSGKDFESLCRQDLAHAEKSIVIFSGFITLNRTAVLGDLFRERIARGVKIRCVTRPPFGNGTISEEETKEALDLLEGLGVTVDLRNSIHEKAVVIDGKMAWFGSLNPLSHTSKTSEIMARVEDEGFASSLVEFLATRRGASDTSDPHRTAAENPRCEKCNSRSVLCNGRFGLFFRCESCDWKADFHRTLSKKHIDLPSLGKATKDAEKCPKCGAIQVLRSGRYGQFFSCSRYPKCDGKAKERNSVTSTITI